VKHIFRFLLLLILADPSAKAQLKWFGKTMSISVAEATFGKDKFNPGRFKSCDPICRSKMAASLVKNKTDWLGKPLLEIEGQLGPYDGFYFSDMVPAYLLTRAANKSEDTWQIVFLPDNADYVKEIIIVAQPK
jgi:hypothetical protein